MIMREVRTFVGGKNAKIEEYVAINGDTGVSCEKEARQAAYEAYLAKCEQSKADGTLVPSTEEFKPDLSKVPQTVYVGVQMVPGGVFNEQGEAIGVTPQEIRFPIPAKTRTEAITNFEKGFEAFVKNMEARAQKQQQEILVPDAQMTQAIENEAKNFRLKRD
jgi:hypothetical protein